MEFITKTSPRQPDDEDVDFCSCCGHKIDLNYDDYYENEASGELICEHCHDEIFKEWKGEIINVN